MGLLSLQNDREKRGLLSQSEPLKNRLSGGLSLTNLFSPTAQSTPKFTSTNITPISIAKPILQGSARAPFQFGISAGQLITDTLGIKPKTTVVQSPNKKIFGSEPIDTIQGEYAKAIEESKRVGTPEYLYRPLAKMGLLGTLASDILPPIFPNSNIVAPLKNGTIPEQFFKTMAKTNKAGDVADLLKTTGLSDDFIKQLSPVFARSKTAQEAKDILIEFSDRQGRATIATKTAQPSPTKGLLAQADTYKGETDLTTKILKDLEGKTTVSKQYILDATNRGELKQVERDLIRSVLDTEGPTIAVKNFAEKVKAELLPLNVNTSNRTSGGLLNLKEKTGKFSPRWEGVTLKEERGNVANYFENVYESPIKTSAGSQHNFPSDSYFGHTRIEDMADNKTRRVIEVQSDLYQKGNLERSVSEVQGKAGDSEMGVAKLSQYNDPTAHFRMVREEIRKAAQDGITKLQFPTGETAMKLEGLGDNTQWSRAGGELGRNARARLPLKVEDLKVGQEVYQFDGMNQIMNSDNRGWVITDILGDGKFKAVQKRLLDLKGSNWKIDIDPSLSQNGNQTFRAYNETTGGYEFQEFTPSKKDEALEFLKKKIGQDSPDKTLSEYGEKYGETFDISGKVDTNNPIYRFYEKDVQKYLAKFGGKKVVDDKGVSWIEVPITKDNAGAVEAFKTYKTLTAGPKYSNTEVEQFIRNTAKELGISNSKLEIYFDKDLIKKIGASGRASSYEDIITGELKHVIEVYTRNGKAPVRVAGHELKHVLDNVIGKEAHAQLRKVAETKMNNTDFKYYQRQGYKTRNEQIDEFMADEWGKKMADKAGYKSRIQKVIDVINKILDKVIALVKKVYQKYKDTPNKQGGFVRVRNGDDIPAKPTSGASKTSSNSSYIDSVDRLIAEGKVRVKSVNGKDVYQYKKGNEWVNARDSDSVVKHFEPKERTPPKTEELPPELEIKKEVLENSPFAHKDNRLLVDREGRVRELGDIKSPKLIRKLEDRMAESGITDPAEFAAGVEKYLNDKKELEQAKKKLKLSAEGIPMSTRAAEARIARQTNKANLPTSTVRSQQKPVSESQVSTQGPLANKEIETLNLEEGEAKSIEILARQAQSILNGEEIPDGVSLPKIIAQTVTPVNERVHLLDTYLRTPDRVLKKIGFGEDYKNVRRAMDAYWKELPKNIDKIEKWRVSVPKESNERIFKYLDGQAITLRPDELLVAKEIKSWLRTWADRLGLAKDERVTDYITRIFDKDFTANGFPEELAKIIADKIPGSIYNPFTLRRLGAKGYKQDTWKALDAYVKRGTRKAHLDPVLETIQAKAGSSLELSNIEKSQWQYIQKYISGINMRPTELDESIDNIVKSVVGKKLGDRPITSTTRILRQMTYRGMLGLNPGSALRNLSQGINTYAILGEKYTTIGYASLLKKGAMDELRTEGVLNAGFIQDKVLSATGKTLENIDKGLFVFFDAAEKINRGAAYFGAKAQGISKGMSEEKAIEYAKSIVRKTQFVFDSVDTPVGMQSDIMKTLFQFQTFTTKQIEFLTELARDKNYLGMLRYAVAGLLFVYTIGQAFGMEPKELLPIYRFDTPPSLKFPVEVVKAVADAPDKYGNDRDLSQKVSDVGKSAIGLIPAGTQAKKTIEGTEAMLQGKSTTKAGNAQFDVGGTLAKDAQAVIFGKYAGQNAKDYYDGDTYTEQKYNELMKSPDRKAAMAEILKTDPALARKIYDHMKEKATGITDAEKKIKNMGVENGQRAKEIAKKYNKLKTKEQKKAFIADYLKKKIITKDVAKQLIPLLK